MLLYVFHVLKSNPDSEEPEGNDDCTHGKQRSWSESSGETSDCNV